MRIVLVEDEPKSREGIVKIIQHYTEHQNMRLQQLWKMAQQDWKLWKEKSRIL